MNKRILFQSLIIGAIYIGVVFSIFISQSTYATDPPHNSIAGLCMGCHQGHGGTGPSLTKDTNANLCISCHTAGQPAGSWPLSSTNEATPGTGGTSHRWDGILPSTDSANNQYGLRPVGNLSNSWLRAEYIKNGAVTCSVCHDQHSQANTPWDPSSVSYGGRGTGGPTNAYGTNGRHFQRMTNYMNEMCEDCHYHRVMDTSAVETYDGNYKSHPVNVAIPSSTTYNTAPLDYSGNPQTGAPRYAGDGTGDTNPTNNLVLDTNGNVNCMSCHGLHYTDSSATTIDLPPSKGGNVN